jgi:hypothetical protein
MPKSYFAFSSALSDMQSAAIDEIFNEDAVFYDPKGGVFRGRDEIDRIACVIKATNPDLEYQAPLSFRGTR